ncbi:zinc ribbon domain-containing protein [Eubacterium xylanophilum]|uniref:zinc ribbon domain-containing protein n=1 Tax=Eubacterium xylanophilum TaxID=39497 RepID=UPI00047887FE|nr:zinc ribbon domain-containing protein [Eubacterium xylanophilum]
MKRYCANCKKEFEFKIAKMSDLDSLVCPECGNPVASDSRAPVDPKIEENEEAIGRTIGNVFYLGYIFYLICGTIGIVAYVFGFWKLLIAMTVISLIVYVLQYFTDTLTFPTGVIFIPIGAAAGWYFFNGWHGACLGIMIVFVARHLIRDVFFGLLWKLVEYGKKS